MWGLWWFSPVGIWVEDGSVNMNIYIWVGDGLMSMDGGIGYVVWYGMRCYGFFFSRAVLAVLSWS